MEPGDIDNNNIIITGFIFLTYHNIKCKRNFFAYLFLIKEKKKTQPKFYLCNFSQSSMSVFPLNKTFTRLVLNVKNKNNHHIDQIMCIITTTTTINILCFNRTEKNILTKENKKNLINNSLFYMYIVK